MNTFEIEISKIQELLGRALGPSVEHTCFVLRKFGGRAGVRGGLPGVAPFCLHL